MALKDNYDVMVKDIVNDFSFLDFFRQIGQFFVIFWSFMKMCLKQICEDLFDIICHFIDNYINLDLFVMIFMAYVIAFFSLLIWRIFTSDLHWRQMRRIKRGHGFMMLLRIFLTDSVFFIQMMEINTLSRDGRWDHLHIKIHYSREGGINLPGYSVKPESNCIRFQTIPYRIFLYSQGKRIPFILGPRSSFAKMRLNTVSSSGLVDRDYSGRLKISVFVTDSMKWSAEGYYQPRDGDSLFQAIPLGGQSIAGGLIYDFDDLDELDVIPVLPINYYPREAKSHGSSDLNVTPDEEDLYYDDVPVVPPPRGDPRNVRFNLPTSDSPERTEQARMEDQWDMNPRSSVR